MRNSLDLSYVSVDELIAYDESPRDHPQWQIEQVKNSINEFGFIEPVVVGRNNQILNGKARLIAAQQLGMDVIPAILVGHLSETQQRAVLVALNKIADNACWDEDRLRDWLQSLDEEGANLDVLGFGDDELAALLGFGQEDEDSPAERGDPDHVPDVEERYVSAVGDIWHLGYHVVMCGDSTSGSQIATLCGGQLADACWTDPPYNVNYEGGAGKIKNDQMVDSDFYRFLRDAFSAASESMAAGAAIYVAHADKEGQNFRRAFSDAGFKLSGCLVWVKSSLVFGRADYQLRHEPILYGWKSGAAHSWFAGRSETTVIESRGESIRVMPDGTLQVDVGGQTVVVSGENMSMRALEQSIIRFDKPKVSADHPTMKPVELIKYMLSNSAKAGHVVLDPFGGSGSTLIACEELGMSARLMELDPRFVDVIVRRYQEFTGKEGILSSSGQTFSEVAKERGVSL